MSEPVVGVALTGDEVKLIKLSLGMMSQPWHVQRLWLRLIMKLEGLDVPSGTVRDEYRRENDAQV